MPIRPLLKLEPPLNLFVRRVTALPLMGLIVSALSLGPDSIGVPAQNNAAQQAGLSREERLRQHRERINRILEERRRQEAANAAAAGTAAQPGTGAAGTPASGGAGAGAGAQPGAPAAAVAPIAGGEARPPAPGGIPPAQGIPGGPQPGGQAAPAGQGAARSEARALIAMYPFDSSIRVGDTFETEVLADARTGAYTSVSFTLSWNPADLNPLALDHGMLSQLGVTEFEYGLDQDKGVLAARIQFPRKTVLSGRPLIKLVWEGLRPAQASEIRFRFDGEVPTGIFDGEENILGTAFAPDDGVLHSLVLIRARKPSTATRRTSDGGVMFGGEKAVIPDAQVGLKLVTDRASVRTGEVAIVSVLMENPRAVPFDRLRLYMQYDPRQAEVLDTDRGNAIRLGLNIREPDRERFAFDFLRTNVVDPKMGTIEFDAGNEVRAIETTGGLVARVALRALRPGPLDVTLVRNAAGLGPDTDVLNAGTSVLRAGREFGAPSVLHGVRIQARGPVISSQQDLDNQFAGANGAASQVLFSSGLTKQRQFGTILMSTSAESSLP